LINSACH